MSDYDSIMLDAALDDCAEYDYQQYRAELREMAEATLIEVPRVLDVDDLLTNQMSLEPYGDSFHAAVRVLIDAVQKEIDRISKQRTDALRIAKESKKRKTEEFWADRIQKALEKKRNNTSLRASQIATLVIEKEIKDKKITDEETVHYLSGTVVDTLRKKLRKNTEFKAIK